ncbi:MAG: ABC transporter ATP-binding protein [Spirochaetaceae bacterium]|nr:ABC transporter ATP-binding protein [Spirochaetaceae bacterium]
MGYGVDQLTISGLTVVRGGKAVLSGGTGSAPSPGVVLCTGPNGSGKTTLLEALAGILPSAGGRVTRGDDEIDLSSDAWRAGVAYLPSDGGTIPLLTCGEQLRLALELSKVNLAESERRIERLAEVYEFHPSLHLRADVLSSGTRKRLGLALVASSAASVFLLDEPSAGLDADGVRVLLETLVVMRRLGATVIVTSHTAGVFADVVDTIWRIVPSDDGAQLIQESPGVTATGRDPTAGGSIPVDLPWLAIR